MFDDILSFSEQHIARHKQSKNNTKNATGIINDINPVITHKLTAIGE